MRACFRGFKDRTRGECIKGRLKEAEYKCDETSSCASSCGSSPNTRQGALMDNRSYHTAELSPIWQCRRQADPDAPTEEKNRGEGNEDLASHPWILFIVRATICWPGVECKSRSEFKSLAAAARRLNALSVLWLLDRAGGKKLFQSTVPASININNNAVRLTRH